MTQHAVGKDMHGVLFYLCYFAFVGLLVTSLVYFVRLLLPVDIAYLDPPKKYYSEYKVELEMLDVGDEDVVNESLKGTYILELEDAIAINNRAFLKKSSLFYNALIFALLAVVPYIVCVEWHISKGK